MVRWRPARRRLAIMAIALATITAAAGIALGGQPWGGALYIAVAVGALFNPTWIVVQVISGQVIAGSHMVGQATTPLRDLPLVAAVIATAELLAAASRLESPLGADPAGEPARALLAAAIGSGAFAVIMLVSGLPGPSGLAATGLASAACVGLAILLVRNARRT
jgi:hypothetical protein